MTATRILLLRHAETSAPDRFHGAESDVGLGQRGHLQAEHAAQYLATLRPDVLYCSAMRRAVETAQPIARACGLAPQVVSSLHERKMGPLSGQLRLDALAAYESAKRSWEAGDLAATHEGGESYADIRRRVVPVWHDLVRGHSRKTLVVVAHGVVIRVLLTSLIPELGPRDFSRVGIDHVAVNDLRWDGEQWTATALNQPPPGLDCVR